VSISAVGSAGAAGPPSLDLASFSLSAAPAAAAPSTGAAAAAEHKSEALLPPVTPARAASLTVPAPSPTLAAFSDKGLAMSPALASLMSPSRSPFVSMSPLAAAGAADIGAAGAGADTAVGAAPPAPSVPQLATAALVNLAGLILSKAHGSLQQLSDELTHPPSASAASLLGAGLDLSAVPLPQRASALRVFARSPLGHLLPAALALLTQMRLLDSAALDVVGLARACLLTASLLTRLTRDDSCGGDPRAQILQLRASRQLIQPAATSSAAASASNAGDSKSAAGAGTSEQQELTAEARQALTAVFAEFASHTRPQAKPDGKAERVMSEGDFLRWASSSCVIA
jgi:hypothetical protein